MVGCLVYLLNDVRMKSVHLFSFGSKRVVVAMSSTGLLQLPHIDSHLVNISIDFALWFLDKQHTGTIQSWINVVTHKHTPNWFCPSLYRTVRQNSNTIQLRGFHFFFCLSFVPLHSVIQWNERAFNFNDEGTLWWTLKHEGTHEMIAKYFSISLNDIKQLSTLIAASIWNMVFISIFHFLGTVCVNEFDMIELRCA